MLGESDGTRQEWAKNLGRSRNMQRRGQDIVNYSIDDGPEVQTSSWWMLAATKASVPKRTLNNCLTDLQEKRTYCSGI